MNHTNKIITAGAAVVVTAAVAYAFWASVMKTVPTVPNGNGAACTADALQCPDGSWVGRSGANCQFVCPIPTSTGGTSQGEVTVLTQINHKVIAIQEGITPLEVLEDSRCPHGVQCIQAGTVRVKVRIDSGSGASQEVFSLNGTITTEAESITLIAVRPEKEAGKDIASTDYTFVFRVVKR